MKGTYTILYLIALLVGIVSIWWSLQNGSYTWIAIAVIMAMLTIRIFARDE